MFQLSLDVFLAQGKEIYELMEVGNLSVSMLKRKTKKTSFSCVYFDMSVSQMFLNSFFVRVLQFESMDFSNLWSSVCGQKQTLTLLVFCKLSYLSFRNCCLPPPFLCTFFPWGQFVFKKANNFTFKQQLLKRKLHMPSSANADIFFSQLLFYLLFSFFSTRSCLSSWNSPFSS